MKHYKTDVVALRKLMIERGFTTNISLAQAAGTDRNTIGKVLNGTVRPSAELMDKLAMALQMDSATAGAIFFTQDLRNA